MFAKTTTALFLLSGLLAATPSASASHSRCHNEPGSDIWLPNHGIPVDAGVDGPLLFDGNGLQVCVGELAVSVETTEPPIGTDGPIGPPAGNGGVVARVCANDGASDDECDGTILLDWTGVNFACSTPNSVCVWVNGDPLFPL